MKDFKELNFNKEIFLSDEFNMGRLIIYSSILEYIQSILENRRNPAIIDKLKAIEALSDKIKKLQETEITPEEIKELYATNCLDMPEIKKDAYLEGLLQFYLNYGYELAENLPPDRIDTELAFLTRVLKDMIGKNEEEKEKYLKIQIRFISVHMLNWIPNCDKAKPLIDVLETILRNDWSLLFDATKELIKKQKKKN